MTMQEQIGKTYKKAGSVHLTAEILGITQTKARDAIKDYLQSIGESDDMVSPHHQNRVIEPFLKYSLKQMRATLMASPNPEMAMVNIDGVIQMVAMHKLQGDLIGVYDKECHTDDMRDDVYWYCLNEMETSNESIN